MEERKPNSEDNYTSDDRDGVVDASEEASLEQQEMRPSSGLDLHRRPTKFPSASSSIGGRMLPLRFLRSRWGIRLSRFATASLLLFRLRRPHVAARPGLLAANSPFPPHFSDRFPMATVFRREAREGEKRHEGGERI